MKGRWAIGLSVILGCLASAANGALVVDYDGTEAGGKGPRQYVYKVDTNEVPAITELRVGTNHLDPNYYTNVLIPEGWDFAILGEGMNHAGGVSTPIGEVSPGAVASRTVGMARWWTDDPKLAVESFVFGFDHPAISEDVGWYVRDEKGTTYGEDWKAPLGGGAGPVHGPYAPFVLYTGREVGSKGPRDFSYEVVSHKDAPIMTFRVATNNLDEKQYTNVLIPDGWKFAVGDFGDVSLGCYGGYTPIGGTALPVKHTTGRYAFWWTEEPSKAVEAYTFGFDYSGIGRDVGWHLGNETGLDLKETSYVLGLGTGPVHGPDSPTAGSASLTVTSNWESWGTVGVDPYLASYPLYDPWVVALTANPPEGFLFQAWVGDVPAPNITDNPLNLTMDKDKTVQAIFLPEDPNGIGWQTLPDGPIHRCGGGAGGGTLMVVMLLAPAAWCVRLRLLRRRR